LRYILIIFSLLLIGCNNQTTSKKAHSESNETVSLIETQPIIVKKQIKTIAKFPNLIFKEENNTIFYETNTTNILLFTNDNKLSLIQKEELTKYKTDFYSINNDKLKKYFKINIFPTIIILDKNSTKKYEGFIPNEVLKYEIKD
jgi:hypothetical protein